MKAQLPQVNSLNIAGNAKALPQKQSSNTALQRKTFGDALSAAALEAEKLNFSKHASSRLSSREVELTPDQMKRVEDGVKTARSKGIADSLVLVDNYALVVNVRSRTVITAMESRDSVFTNIDGAVIV